MLEAVLCANSCDAQNNFNRMLRYPPGRHVDEGHVRVEAFKKGRHVPCEGMAGREPKGGIEDIAERLDDGVETKSLLLRNAVRLGVTVNRARVSFGC